jgi:4-amino-4-deoxy-L-arabinose transferase-like glycosyltransferase
MGRALDVAEPIGPHAAAAAEPAATVALGSALVSDKSPPARPADLAAQWPERLLAWVDHHRKTLFAGLALFYLLSFNGQWRMEPDSALYLTLGRNVADGLGYTYHGQPHRLAYPGLPWLFAGLFKLFGAHSVLPHLIVMPLLGLAALALCYRLFLLHTGRAVAVLVTLTLGVSRTFYRYNFELLSEVPFLVGVLAFLVGWESVLHRRREGEQPGDDPTRGRHRGLDWLLLFGGLGVAVITRPTMWSLLLAAGAALPFWALERPVRWRRVLIVLAAAAIAGVAMIAYLKRVGSAGYEHDLIATATGNSNQLVRQALFQTGPDLLQPNGFEALFGFDIGHIQLAYLHLGNHDIPVAVPFSLLVIGCGLALFRRRPIWGLFVLFTMVMMLVRVVHVRYFLQVLPLLIYGFWLFATEVYRRVPPKWGHPLFAAMVVLLLVVNAGRSLAFVIEQRATPFLARYKEGAFVPIVGVAEQLKRHTPEHAWVLAPEKTDRILTNLTGRYVAAPNATIDFRPQWQTLYVLEPMDEDGRRWMREKHIGSGQPVGEPVPGRRKGRTWQIHKAILLPP